MSRLLSPKFVATFAMLWVGGMVLASTAEADTGVVKWWNDSKGIGAITPDDGSEDLIVRFSAIETKGLLSLRAGQRVRFDSVHLPKAKGAEAAHVRSEP